MQRTSWKLGAWPLWAAAVLSAGLLELPFPLAGPLPVWRTVFAWFGLVPLLVALLSPACVDGPRPLRRGFLLAYVSGFLWYVGNCYWVRDTMSKYGDLPAVAPAMLLVGYSLVLGLYFGVFGLGVALAAASGGLVSTLFPFTVLSGGAYQLKSFVVTILAGLGNPFGALLAGALLGLLEGAITPFIAVSWVPLIEFALFVLVLIAFPRGIFGKAA